MSFRLGVHKGEASMTRQEVKAQLANHVVQQPESKQAFHKWMKVLEVASLALVAAAFAVAMYISINHTAVSGTAIATAWFAFPVSVALLMILIGVHAIGLRAYFPIVLPGKPQRFVTGSKAVWSGMGLIAIGLIAAAFWGTFAWAAWSGDMGLIMVYGRILGTAMGVVIPVAMVAALFQQIFRSR
jgi:hypothetical protein